MLCLFNTVTCRLLIYLRKPCSIRRHRFGLVAILTRWLEQLTFRYDWKIDYLNICFIRVRHLLYSFPFKNWGFWRHIEVWNLRVTCFLCWIICASRTDIWVEPCSMSWQLSLLHARWMLTLVDNFDRRHFLFLLRSTRLNIDGLMAVLACSRRIYPCCKPLDLRTSQLYRETWCLVNVLVTTKFIFLDLEWRLLWCHVRRTLFYRLSHWLYWQNGGQIVK